MEFAEVVRSRRMCRRYDAGREVEDATLTRLLGLAGRAPSAGFSQGRDFVVLRESRSRDDFWAISTATTGPPPGETPPDDTPPGETPHGETRHGGSRRGGTWLEGMRTAPVLILCLSDPQRYLDRYALPDKGRTDRDPRTWPVPYWDVDAGMAALIILLAAEDAGLGACFFGVERGTEAALGKRFAVPGRHRFVGVVSLGHRPARRDGPVGESTGNDAVRAPRPYRPEGRAIPDYVHAERFGRPWPVSNPSRGVPSGGDALRGRRHEA